MTGGGEARAVLRLLLADRFRAAGLDGDVVERAAGAVLGMVDTVHAERGTNLCGEWTRVPDEIPAHYQRFLIVTEPIERFTDARPEDGLSKLRDRH